MQMTEAEVRSLCIKSRELFLSQPILLELEAPLKICGKKKFICGILPLVFLNKGTVDVFLLITGQ